MPRNLKFIESIRVEKGKPQLLPLHQKRLDATLSYHSIDENISLKNLFSTLNIIGHQTFKWRIIYGKNGVEHSEIQPYFPKRMEQFRIVEVGDFSYPFKFLDRQFFEKQKRAENEEILLTHRGQLTDSTFSNLIFSDGKNWYTPKSFLLNGVQRQHLIETNKITEREITVRDLHHFISFKLINAMLPFEQSNEYQMAQISLL